MIVVDASALVELLLRGEKGALVAERLFARRETLHAPHLVDVEVAHVLRRFSATGELKQARGAEAMRDLADLRLRRYPHVALLSRIWELRRNLTAYDGAYIALAESLRAPILTCDERMSRAAGHAAEIEIV